MKDYNRLVLKLSLKSITNVFITLVISLLLLFPEVAKSQNRKVNLSYSFPAGKAVSYKSISTINQEMEVNGQVMVVNVVSTLGCSILSEGRSGSDQLIRVSIDTLAQTTDTQGIYNGGALEDAIGKSFTMKLSQGGKESGLEAANAIIIGHPDGTTTTAGQSFSNFFPDLPVKAVGQGSEWMSSDTLISKTSNLEQMIIIDSKNKFDSYENVNGISCAKILYTVSGTMVMKTRSQGMDLKIQGPVTGSGLLFFAVDKGYFIKQEAKNTMTGTLEIMTPENVSIPVKLIIDSVTGVLP